MQKLLFYLSLAWRSLRSNALRTILTVMIIALGITVLVGILTATEVMKNTVRSSFSSMGANSFQIKSGFLSQRKKRQISFVDANEYPISLAEAQTFKQRFSLPATISISTLGAGTQTAAYQAEKTNPNIQVMGVDNAYLKISDTRLAYGRSFQPYEQMHGLQLCIIGYGIANTLFKGQIKNAINATINLGSHKFRVIGVAESKGGSMMMNTDNLVQIPLLSARKTYGSDNFVLNVMVDNIKQRDLAIDEAEGLFRIVRKLPVGTESNFTLQNNNSMAEMVASSIDNVSWAALIVAIVTLLGSVIGLMNIMLVSVAERTREIGIAKALGAKSSLILQQFLAESIVISLLGGILGIVLGISLGNLLGIALETPFIVPWFWMMMALTLCAFVGMISGVYPAIKASRLNPINALRYE